MIEYFEKINHDNLIQNLSGIGTFFTSLITLFTLFVLIKQRKDSFRPRVIFGDRLYGKCRAKDNEILKTKWEDRYPKKSEKVIDFGFELLNIGVGVAENVIVKEKFDYKRAKKFVQKYDKESEFVIDIQKDSVEVRTTFDNSFVLTFVQNKRELGTFIMTRQTKPHKYIFNDVCLTFLSIYDYLREKYGHDVSLDKFPICYYEILYSDIEGKNYSEKYKCKVESILKDDYTFTFMKK